jgi:transposase
LRRRFELTDEKFGRIEELLPEVDACGFPYEELQKKVVNGLFWILRTGTPWRDLLDGYGEWQTVYDRFRT